MPAMTYWGVEFIHADENDSDGKLISTAISHSLVSVREDMPRNLLGDKFLLLLPSDLVETGLGPAPQKSGG